ncbi:MAG: type II toxin-antitoxin system PemK/MazF family toxin [Pirellulales bacterium]|nr:type II toxin-antitoxin system PemK/MazF family toxin [Pirellulales bacterium]
MKRGEVVLVDFPFSDGSGSKFRPALVVQADIFNKSLRDTVLATITTNTQPSPTSFVIDPSENPHSGLRLACAVRCDNLQTLEQTIVQGSIGYLSRRSMQQIDACLKLVLGL